MLKKFEYKHKPHYGKEVAKFDNGHGAVFWSAKDVCKILEIEDAEAAIGELDPDSVTERLVLPDEDETNDTKAKKIPQKVVILNWKGLSALLFRSQAPMAKKFQRFVNDNLFFDMFLHWSPYFDNRWRGDCIDQYESIMKDLREQLGVWG